MSGGTGPLVRALALLTSLVCSTLPALTATPATRPPAPTLDSIKQLLEDGESEEAVRQARVLVHGLDQDGKGESAATADILDQLVEAFRAAKADSTWVVGIARRVSELRLKLDGENLAYARSLFNYGRQLHGTHHEDEARSFLDKALTIRERLLDAADPAIAMTLNALGSVAGEMGDLTTARGYYERALKVYNLSEGLARHEARVTLFNLGKLLELIGDYAAVRDLWEGFLREIASLPDAEPMLASKAWALISEMDQRLGETRAASEDFEKALGNWDAVHAKAELLRRVPMQEQANGATRLATAARAIGELQVATKLYLEGVTIRERLRGIDHYEVAWDLYQLAEMLQQNGNDTAARPYLDRAIGIVTKDGSIVTPLRIRCLKLLCVILRESGELTRARELIRTTIEQAVWLYGSDHPEVAPLLEEQSRLSLVNGDPEAARNQALRAEAIANRHFTRTAARLSHGEALRYQDVRLSGLDLALSSLGARDTQTSLAAEQVWGAVIHARGLVLDELIARRRVVATARDPGIDALVKQLEIDRGRLAHAVVRGPVEDSGGESREKVRLLLRDQEATERRLAAASAVFRRHLTAQAAGWAQVRNALPGGTALVGYVRYQRFHREGNLWKETPSYIALVKPAGAATRFIPLGGAEWIDTLISRWRDIVSEPPYTEPTADASGTLAVGNSAGEALRKAIWDPVERLLGNERIILIVPDGNIHQVNLAALPDGAGNFLVESDRAFHYLVYEKDLGNQMRMPHGGGLLAMGAPDFGHPRPALDRGTTVSRGEFNASSSLPLFLPLAGARSEVEQVADLWTKNLDKADRDKTHVLVGPDATESQFSRLAPGTYIIHLATHAFADTGNSIRTPSGSGGILLGSNPLLTSGLALAGANSRGLFNLSDTNDDGVLLGEEILSLNLSGVAWVVLSACNTGLGPIMAREGVQGLRRSFQAAGAATVITTLWDVEDSATRDWMIALYRARQSGLSTVESLRQASRDFIALARTNGRVPYPYYWGGFIATGDWR